MNILILDMVSRKTSYLGKLSAFYFLEVMTTTHTFDRVHFDEYLT